MHRDIRQDFIEICKRALKEDGAYNDITTQTILLKEDKFVEFELNAREEMIICGSGIFNICVDLLLEECKSRTICNTEINLHHKDGDKVAKGTSILSGKGDAKLIYAAERVALNLTQHLSGISTMTKKYIDELNNSKIKILDTRKTIVGLRSIQKYAVKIGGGYSHRYNLEDAILIKDNHIALFNNTSITLKKFYENLNLINNEYKFIEVECDNLHQVKEAIEFGPDVIMLDNFSLEDVKLAINIINKKAKIEISGGINLDNISKYKDLDVDFISIGSLTNSVKAVDIGLDIVNVRNN